jgi:hypothetical protein
LQGIVKSDGPAGVELFTAEAKKLTIPAAEIESKQQTNLSLMPNGLKDGMTLEDFCDIVAYLESLKDAPAQSGR